MECSNQEFLKTFSWKLKYLKLLTEYSLVLKLKAPSTLVAAGLIKLKKTLAVTCTTFQFWSLFTLVAGGVIV